MTITGQDQGERVGSVQPRAARLACVIVKPSGPYDGAHGAALITLNSCFGIAPASARGRDVTAAEDGLAEDEPKPDLRPEQDPVEEHPGPRTLVPSRIMVQKAWARAAKMAWRHQPTWSGLRSGRGGA